MMDVATQKSPARRPGGRSETVSLAIRRAVEELVAERGGERVTIPMVADRAGVNPTSIYRRWGDAAAMINDIATYRLDPNRPLPDTGELRGDLTEWAQEFLRHYLVPVNAALLRGGAAGAGESMTDCLRHRRIEVAAMLERYPSAARPSVEDVVDHVISPIIYRAIFVPWTLDDTTAARLVDHLLD